MEDVRLASLFASFSSVVLSLLGSPMPTLRSRAQASLGLSLFCLLCSLINLTCGQVPNNETFCNRLYHSVAVANDKLYVDGGELRTV